MRHGRIAKLLVTLLAFITVFCGNAGIPRALADSAGKVEYIADVQLFQGGTMTECELLCEQMGYKPTGFNINQGAMEKVPILTDDPAPCVMLGYKTTNDRARSLTGISVLHMGEGYETRDFQSVAASLVASNRGLAESMASAAVEFQTNYDLGAPAAVMAFRLLDLLYVDPLSKHSFAGYTDGKKYDNDEMMDISACKAMLDKNDPTKPRSYEAYDSDEHESLAYFILEGNADTEFFCKLLTYGTPSIVSAVHKALIAGAAEYENYYDSETGESQTKVWADRLRDGDAKRLIEGGLTTDQWRQFDRAYMDSARDLVEPIQNFATLYLNAKSRGASKTDFTNREAFKDLSDLPDWCGSLKDGDADWTYMLSFEILNQYQYEEGKPLGDWIVDMGLRTYSSDEDYRSLYPLVDVIGPTQVTLLRFCGMSTFVSSMCQPDDDDQGYRETLGNILESLKGFSEGSSEWRICVWEGVDNTVYGGTVGLTSDVIRVSGANAVMQMNKSERYAEYKKYIGWYLALATGWLTFVQAGVQFIASFAPEAVAVAAAEAGTATISATWAGVLGAAELLGKLTFWLWIAELVISVAVALGVWLYNEFTKPQSDYSVMPTLVFDTRTMKTGPVVVRYSAVWEPLRGRVGDANAYVGSKWNCLYVTRDTRAGTPLVVGEGKDPFVLRSDGPTEPSGYVAASLFGQQSAANLNNGAYDVKDDRQNYLFYTTEGSLKGEADGLNEGEESANKDGLYVADIVLATADSDERARAKITSKKGRYYLFDRNLGSAETPIYIGYSLTSIESDAVRDIRVFASSSDSEVSFGQASYSLSGNLANGDGLYISRSELVGTPIKANFRLVEDKKDVPEGFEPVVFGSGAPVYLFGTRERPYAMYFEPKVKYTTGDTYVAGIGFITGESLEGDSNSFGNRKTDWDLAIDLQNSNNGAYNDVLGQASWQDGVLASDMARFRQNNLKGLPKVETMHSLDRSYAINMMSGLGFTSSTEEQSFTGQNLITNTYYCDIGMCMYMVVAFTHNPYRAICDVGTYTSTTKNTIQIPAMFPKVLTWKKNDVEKSAAVSYIACEEVLSGVTRFVHGITATTRGQHAYLSSKAREGLDSLFTAPRDDGSGAIWERSPLRLSGLYVLGPVEGIDPLKTSDLVVGTQAHDSTDSDGDIGCTMPEGTFTVDGTGVSGEEFRSVQDLRFPYNLAAQNLSYPAFTDAEGESVDKTRKNGMQKSSKNAGESDHLYLYLRGKVHKPRYIASVNVGSYTDEAFKEANKGADKGMLNEMAKMADDVAYQGALATCSEVVPQNLSAGDGDWWATAVEKDGKSTDKYGKSTTYRRTLVSWLLGTATVEYKTSTAYLGITRTDDPAKALRGLALVSEEDVKTGAAAAGTITIGGNTKYMLPNGSSSFAYDDYVKPAFLYYTYNSASLPGCPMTDLTVSAQVFEQGRSTVTFGSATGETGNLYGRHMKAYIHCATERDRGVYLNGVYVGVGRNFDAALMDLLAQGATEAVVTDLNTGSTPVVIGYRTVAFDDGQIALHERTKGTTSDPLREVIRDVVVTVGEPLRETLVHNGVVYKPVGDKSLNGERRAPKIYLYQCMDHYTIAYNRSQDSKGQLVVPSLMSKFRSPITKIGVAYGSRVPYNASDDEWAGGEKGDLEVWENLLNTRGERVDLNYGVVSDMTQLNLEEWQAGAHEIRFKSYEELEEYDQEQILREPDVDKVVDNRCYLFFHRLDNSVKPGAEIVGGTLAPIVMKGELYEYGV